MKIQNKAEIDRLVNQHAIDIESMKEKHKLELESKEKEQLQKIYEKLYEEKVVEYIRGKVKVTEKAISADEFAKLAGELA